MSVDRLGAEMQCHGVSEEPEHGGEREREKERDDGLLPEPAIPMTIIAVAFGDCLRLPLSWAGCSGVAMSEMEMREMR